MSINYINCDMIIVENSYTKYIHVGELIAVQFKTKKEGEEMKAKVVYVALALALVLTSLLAILLPASVAQAVESVAPMS